MNLATPLPIDAILGELRETLTAHTSAVLAHRLAPAEDRPTFRFDGRKAGSGSKILVLEPRRIAARAAAERMARPC
jgi:ATP-dependent helicase HrpB